MSGTANWEPLRARLPLAGGMYQPASTGCCAVCRGPVTRGYRRCYQCESHVLAGGGLLSDAVIPVCYAVQGTPFGHLLWSYKDYKEGPTACGPLLALLLVFLREHAACAWRRAGIHGPGRLAVVPSGSGRPSPHPLLRMTEPYLRLPQVVLTLRPGEQGRDLNVDRFRASPVARTSVLLLDDTWVSGASAQSAAAALKRAGASRVVTIVLARLLATDDPRAMALARRRYDPRTCAVHEDSHG